MPKNVSSSEDVIGNLALPINQLRDLGNMIKNRSFISELDKANEIKIGNVRISKLNERGNGIKGFLKFQYKGRWLMFYYDSKNRLAETLGMINDEFIKEESARFSVRKKNVVDVGAYNADTAICYVANGARHVYAFEPYPYYYNLGIKNIKANRLANKITMVNAGCGSKTGKTTIDRHSSDFTNIRSSKGRNKSPKRIDIVSLGHIVERYNIKNAALKIDCEGCEYDIIFRTDPNVLRRFSDIQIEYHYGYGNLEKKLIEMGFRVRHTRPIKKYNFTSKSFMVLGFINAKRL
jgi:FkbM family methyltransferase